MSRLFKRNKHRASEDSEDQVMNISGPTNVTHDTHVGFDLEKGIFTGLPQSWKQWLQAANIRYTGDLVHCYMHIFFTSFCSAYWVIYMIYGY